MATCAEAFHTSSRHRMSSNDGVPVASVPDSCTQLALPMPPSIGQLSTGSPSSAAGQRGDQPAVGHQHHRPIGFVGPPVGLLVDQLRAPAACCASATSTRLSPPCGAQRASSRHASRAPGAAASTSRCVIPCQSPRCVSRSRVSTRTGSPDALAERDSGVQRAPQIRRDDQQRLTLGQHLGRGDGLFAAEVAQVGVQLALHPAARVVLGLPVPQHHQSADRHFGRLRGIVQIDRNHRAVAPQPVQRIEVAFVLMLDVHHDVDVIEQRPATFAGALAAGRFVPGGAHLLLDLVDDGVDLPLVGRRRDDEAVGDDQLARHVDDDDVVGEFGGRRLCGDRGHVDGLSVWRSRCGLLYCAGL